MSRQVKFVFKEHAKQLDIYQKNGYEYYIQSKIDLLENVDKHSFNRIFGNQLTQLECELVFNALEMNSVGKVRVYQYVSCMETFCRHPLSAEQRVKMQAQSDYHPIFLGINIPLDVLTPQYFSQIKVQEQIYQTTFISIFQHKFSLPLDQINQVFDKMDVTKKGSLFGYQIFTLVDLYRNCISNGKIVRDIPNLPFMWEANVSRQFRVLLGSIADYLDSIAKPTADYFQQSPFEQLTVREFINITQDFDQHQRGDIFRALDFLNEGKIVFYHFLAVVESYRRKIIDNERIMRTGTVLQGRITSKRLKEPLMQHPLQEALSKLGKYFSGQNSKKRPLQSSELFGLFDYDGDGKITSEQFLRCLKGMQLDISQHQMMLILQQADFNNNGIIEYQEFAQFVEEFFKKQLGKQKELEPAGSLKFKKRPVYEIKGLRNSINSFPQGSLQQGIYSLKVYAQTNYDSLNSLEFMFHKLDSSTIAKLTHAEFNVALHQLRIGLSDTQRSELVKLADTNKDGAIDYKEFIDFVYDYDFKTPLKPVQQEKVASRGLQDILNYKIDPQLDYFRTYQSQNTTILNSETAALKRCIQLYKKSQQDFIDPDFGPEQQKKGAFCLYWNGNPPNSNYPPAEDLQWLSPQSWQDRVSFFNHDISSNDVIQGSLGDCWFIGALSVLATRDQLIRGSLHELTNSNQITVSNCLGTSKGVYPPIFHPFHRKGIYVMRFFKNAQWRWVIIDQRVPCFNDGNQPQYVFGKCRDQSELWVALIQKAYAKLHGCYQSLNGGLIDDGLVDLTGHVAEKVKVKSNMTTGNAIEQTKKADDL